MGEDRGRGRNYLPQEDLVRFGYSEAELLAGTLNDNWRALMAFQLERARSWFARSEAGVRWLSADARWPVSTSLRLYHGILAVIERHNYDVFNNRAYVPRADKLLDLPLSFIVAQGRKPTNLQSRLATVEHLPKCYSVDSNFRCSHWALAGYATGNV